MSEDGYVKNKVRKNLNELGNVKEDGSTDPSGKTGGRGKYI